MNIRIVSKGKTLQSPEFVEKKRRHRRAISTYIASSLLALIVVLVLVSRIDKLQIKTVEAQGNTITKDEEIISLTIEELGGRYLWLIPKSNSLIYPKGKIKRKLTEALPRLKDINIERRSGVDGLLVSVSERDEYALYCIEVAEDFSALDCYYLDIDGLIYSKAPLFSGQVYFIYKIDPPITEPIGMNVLPPEEFYKLRRFIEETKKFGMDPNSLSIPADESTLSTKSGGKIIWNREDLKTAVFGNLESFLLDPNIKEDKTFLDRMLYIDLRYQNKVFYKLKK